MKTNGNDYPHYMHNPRIPGLKGAGIAVRTIAGDDQSAITLDEILHATTGA